MSKKFIIFIFFIILCILVPFYGIYRIFTALPIGDDNFTVEVDTSSLGGIHITNDIYQALYNISVADKEYLSLNDIIVDEMRVFDDHFSKYYPILWDQQKNIQDHLVVNCSFANDIDCFSNKNKSTEFSIIKYKDNNRKNESNCSSSSDKCEAEFSADRSGPEGLYSVMYYEGGLSIEFDENIRVYFYNKIDSKGDKKQAQSITEQSINNFNEMVKKIEEELDKTSSDGCYLGTGMEKFIKVKKSENGERSISILNLKFVPGYTPPIGGDMQSINLQINGIGNNDGFYRSEIITPSGGIEEYFFVIPNNDCQDEQLYFSQYQMISPLNCAKYSDVGDSIAVNIYELSKEDVWNSYHKTPDDIKSGLFDNQGKLIYSFDGVVDCPDSSLYKTEGYLEEARAGSRY